MREEGLNPGTIIDTHAHLDDEGYTDREGVLSRARAAGVARIITVGVDLPTSRAAVALAAAHPDVYAVVGVHPHEATRFDAQVLAALDELARLPKVVAIGEIGLDFYRDLSPRDAQRAAFRAQLELAARLGLPVVIHDRDAHAEVMARLREWALAGPGNRERGVLHCFSGDEEMAREAIDLGFYVSLAGPVTFPKATRLQHLATTLPLDRLLVETDCPYLTPEPLRGRRNEPANVRFVAERVAALRGLALAELARATTANAVRLFRLSGDAAIL
ncbi:MAG: TatD family hydrolase [Chloroflexota bacterium]